MTTDRPSKLKYLIKQWRYTTVHVQLYDTYFFPRCHLINRWAHFSVFLITFRLGTIVTDYQLLRLVEMMKTGAAHVNFVEHSCLEAALFKDICLIKRYYAVVQRFDSTQKRTSEIMRKRNKMYSLEERLILESCHNLNQRYFVMMPRLYILTVI